MVTTAEDGRLPLAFTNREQFEVFKRDFAAVMANLESTGLALIIGTAATFYSLDPDLPLGYHFDHNGRGSSDLDIVIFSFELSKRLFDAGDPAADNGFVFGGEYVFFANEGDGAFMSLVPSFRPLVERWRQELGRPIDLRLAIGHDTFDSEMYNFEPPPIEVFRQAR